MHNDIWKWILSQKDNKELSLLSNKLNISVPGFRTGKVIGVNRLIFEKQLLTPKNLNKLTETIKITLTEQYQDLDVHNADIEQLKKEMEDEILPSIMLTKLLTEKLDKKANNLFFSYTIDELNKLEVINRKKMESRGQQNKTEIKLKNQIKKLEQKIEKLTKGVQETNEKYKEKCNKLKKELDESKISLLKYKSENEKLSSKANHFIIKKEMEKKELTLQINVKNKVIEQQKEQIKKLKEEILIIKNEVRKVNFINKKKTINILCLGNPHNNSIFSKLPLNIKIVNRSELNSLKLSNNWSEIWILKYRIPKKEIKEIINRFPKNIIIYFDTFQDLKEYIKRGFNEDEKKQMEC